MPANKHRKLGSRRPYAELWKQPMPRSNLLFFFLSSSYKQYKQINFYPTPKGKRSA